MRPQRRYNFNLPSVASKLVIFAGPIFASTVVIIALDAAPFPAESTLEHLLPADFVLLPD